MNQAVTTLPLLLAPQRDVIPHAYVLHHRTQICRACGSLHEWTEQYVKTHLRSRSGQKIVTNLRPLEYLEFNLPVEVLHCEPKRVHFCHECLSQTSVSHLPSPPIPTGAILSIGPDSAAAAGKKPAVPAARTLSPSDLLALL